MVERRITKMRIGMGYDVHRLIEGRKLVMGGVEIPYEKGLLGHSDADVLLHAIMDALLEYRTGSWNYRRAGKCKGHYRGRAWLYRNRGRNFSPGNLPAHKPGESWERGCDSSGLWRLRRVRFIKDKGEAG